MAEVGQENLSSVYGHGQRHASPLRTITSRTLKQRRLDMSRRQRAVRACDGCRRVKEKCEGGTPCRRCIHFGRPCNFTEPAPPRIPNDNLYKQSPEPANSTVRDLTQRSTYMGQILKHHFPQIDLSISGLKQTVQTLDTDGLPRQITPERSTSADDGDLAIDDENPTIDAVDDNTAHYSGEFSYWNFSMRVKRHVGDLKITANDTDRGENDQVPDYWRVEMLDPQSTSVSEAFTSRPPRPIADFLVHVFYKHVERNYFFVRRSWLEAKVATLYQNPSILSPKDAGPVSIILMIFAIGTQYAQLESAENGSRTESGPESWEHELGGMFYRHAIKLLPEIIHLGSMESVQACLLFGLYALPIDASGLAYMFLNLAIKLGIQNGLHRKISSGAFSPSTIEIRNRTWWTVYCIEKKVGIFHGRPLSIMASDIDAELPKDQIELNDTDHHTDVSRFLVSIQLMDHLEKFLNEIAMLRKSEKAETSTILYRLLNLNKRFINWWISLPYANDISLNASPSDGFRPTMHLRLEYCLVRMFVGRPFLFSYRTSGTSPSALSISDDTQSSISRDSGSAGSASTKRPSRTSALVEGCIQAAREAIGICRSLRDSETGLAKASYVEYSSCRASLLALIAYCISNQTDEFFETLKVGLDIIRAMSTAGESAKSEILLIESLDRALKRLYFFRTTVKNSEPRNSNSCNISYDSFKQWGSSWNTTTSGGSMSQSAQPNPDNDLDSRIDSSDRQMRESEYHGWEPKEATSNDGSVYTESMMFSIPHWATDSPFFDLDTTAAPYDYLHSERQLLDNFLAMPEYELRHQR